MSALRKYFYVYAISLQNVLQRRASLVMDRIGGIAAIVTLYYFWSALFAGRKTVVGYSREQMLTYVLMINLLRSCVILGRGWEVVGEISSGRLSSYLLRPIRYLGYCLSLDLAQKSVHLGAAVLEVAVLILAVGAPWVAPRHAGTWLLFAASVAMSSLLFFLMEFIVASLAFWTSESGGPLFCFELFVQFAAGAFFPLDVLPRLFQNILRATPFPYLIFFPMDIYLERVSRSAAGQILGIQAAWLALIGLATSVVWRRGLGAYAAEGG